MKEIVVKTVLLKNGLELIFFDRSRRIAGDRWQIEILARMDIQIDNCLQVEQTVNPITAQDMKNVLGERVSFEKIMVLNFIDEKEKDSTVMNMCESYLSSAEEYLSHKDFAERFLKKTYREIFQKRQLENLIKKGVDDGG